MNYKKSLLVLSAFLLFGCENVASSSSTTSKDTSENVTTSENTSTPESSSSNTSFDVSDEHDYLLKSSEDNVFTYACSHCNKEVAIAYTSGTSDCFVLEKQTLTFSNITEETAFSIAGEFYGNIVIDAGDYKFELELSGLNLITDSATPISITSGDKVTISSKKQTTNSISDLQEEYGDEDSAIYALCDLSIQGKGSLSVSSNGKGIHTKKDLKIKNVELTVNAYDDALKGNDSVTIESGTLNIISKTGDGIKTSDSDVSSKGNQRGNISITGGTINIFSACDGLDASYNSIIEGETVLNIVTDKYSSYSEEVTDTTEGTIYIRSSSTNYKYSIKYFNDEKEAYYNSSSYQTVNDFRNSYYYYPISKPSGYSKMILYVYTNQTQGQDSDYYFASDSLTVNSNYDTLAFLNNRVEWTNKQTSTRPGGGPGGFEEGNKDKGDHSTKGIKASNEIIINAGEINIKSYDDSIHANNDDTLENGETPLGDITINGGNLTLYSNDDAIHADNKVLITDGTIDIINSYEGIEGAFVEIDNGDISVISSDDGLNGTSTSGESIVLKGGTLYVFAGGDGVDSNSKSSYDGILFDGVKAVIISYGQSDSSIDTENGYKYSSGYILGIGLSGGMSKESTSSSPSFTSIGKSTTLSLQENSYLKVDGIVEVKIPKSMSAFIVYLNSNNVNISTSSTGSSDINWLV